MPMRWSSWMMGEAQSSMSPRPGNLSESITLMNEPVEWTRRLGNASDDEAWREREREARTGTLETVLR
jgi:hypothetical protein